MQLHGLVVLNRTSSLPPGMSPSDTERTSRHIPKRIFFRYPSLSLQGHFSFGAGNAPYSFIFHVLFRFAFDRTTVNYFPPSLLRTTNSTSLQQTVFFSHP